jgi:hypothetical protein
MVLLALIVLPGAFAAKPKKPPRKPPPPKLPACPHDPTLGRVAYVRDGALHVVTFGKCADRVVVSSGAAGPVKFSADGQYIAFSGGIVPSAGGRVRKGGMLWAPAGHVNARITSGGGVYIGQHRILPERWGAISAVFTLQGNLLISRAKGPHNELWIWFQDTGNVRKVGGPFKQAANLAGVSTDGSRAFWWPRSGSVDGPLLSKALAAKSVSPPVTSSMLTYPDYLTWCGLRLVVVSGSSTAPTAQNELLVASPPSFKAKTLVSDTNRSWSSPSCSSATGQIVAMAQPANTAPHWQIWTVGLNGSRTGLVSPPKGQSYESPTWSPGNSGAILFVRRLANGTGQLMVLKSSQIYGPIAVLGSATGTGHHDWWANADSHQ